MDEERLIVAVMMVEAERRRGEKEASAENRYPHEKFRYNKPSSSPRVVWSIIGL